MASREELLEKAKERGYSLVMHSSDKNWYSFMNDRRAINLQLYVNSEEFVLSHMDGIINSSTGNCGSFMNDEHFKKIERLMRNFLFRLL